MAEVKWIKIVTDIFDDEKILIIESMPEADALIVIWFKLLCLAGKQNNSGVFMMNERMPYTDEMFAAIFRRPIATVRLALTTFENLGMVEIVNQTVTIPNWGKHQNLEKIEQRKDYMKGYMREYRERQKLISTGQDPVNVNVNTNVNANEADSKPDVSSLEEDIDIESRYKSKSIEKEGDIDSDNGNNVSCPELRNAHSAPAANPTPSGFDIPLNDGSLYNVPMENIERYRELYPAVDIDQALRNMIGWCEANTKRRKTRKGIKAFITSWLTKEQDRGHAKGGYDSGYSGPDYYGPTRPSYPGETVL